MDCPWQGRADGQTCRIEVFPQSKEALDGVAEVARLEVLYGLHRSRRDLVKYGPRDDAWHIRVAFAGSAESDRHLDRHEGDGSLGSAARLP